MPLTTDLPHRARAIVLSRFPLTFRCAALLAILVALQWLTAQPLRATEPAPCTPEAGACLTVTLQQTPYLRPVAASSDWLAVEVLGDASTARGVRLYGEDAILGFDAQGMIDIAGDRIAMGGNALYAVEGGRILHTFNTANPLRPARTYQQDMGSEPIYDALATEDALYLAGGGASGLTVLSLSAPLRPTVVAQVGTGALVQLEQSGERLFAATPSGLAVINIANALQPALLSSESWFTDAVTSTVDLHVEQAVVYVMARTGGGTGWSCRIVQIDPDGAQHDTGSCPFPPARTTFFDGRAWVNPNTTTAQFLDYERYSLAQPEFPTFEANETVRFANPVVANDALFASSLDGRLEHLTVAGDGHLIVSQTTWSNRDALLTPMIFAGDDLLADAGAASGAQRAFQFLDLSNPTAPAAVGSFESPWISASALSYRDGKIASLRANTITLFDVRNPADVSQLGQVSAETWEDLTDVAWGDGAQLVALAGGSVVLTVDTSNPMSPTFTSRLDLTGDAASMLAVSKAVYLFDEGEMAVVDATAGEPFTWVRTVPGVALPDAAATDGRVVFLLQDGGVKMLDATDPFAPVAAAPPPLFAAATATDVVDLLPIVDQQLVVISRTHDDSRRAAESTGYVATVYDLIEPLQPREIARIEGLATADLVYGAGMAVLPDLTTVAIGPQQRVWTSFTPGNEATFSPASGVTYTIPASAASATIQGDRVCAEDVTRAAPTFKPGAKTPYTAIHELTLYDCASGVTIVPAAPVGARVDYPASTNAWPMWTTSQLMLDGGSAWQTWKNASNDGVALTGALQPLRPWAVLGAPPDPVRLPLVRKEE